MTLPPRPPAWLVALVSAALAIAAAVLVPESRWDKLGTVAGRIIEDPAGFAVLVGALGTALATLRAAWVRVPSQPVPKAPETTRIE